MNLLRMPKLLAFLCFGLPLAASLPVLAVAQTSDAAANNTVRNIVLVHGAWANGSSWSHGDPASRGSRLPCSGGAYATHFAAG